MMGEWGYLEYMDWIRLQLLPLLFIGKFIPVRGYSLVKEIMALFAALNNFSFEMTYMSTPWDATYWIIWTFNLIKKWPINSLQNVPITMLPWCVLFVLLGFFEKYGKFDLLQNTQNSQKSIKTNFTHFGRAIRKNWTFFRNFEKKWVGPLGVRKIENSKNRYICQYWTKIFKKKIIFLFFLKALPKCVKLV